MLNEGLEIICPRCFEKCGVERITFPRTLRYIEDEAFMSCKGLKQVDLTNSALESVDVSAFFESGLESFTAPPSLCAVGERAFSDCK